MALTKVQKMKYISEKMAIFGNGWPVKGEFNDCNSKKINFDFFFFVFYEFSKQNQVHWDFILWHGAVRAKCVRRW